MKPSKCWGFVPVASKSSPCCRVVARLLAFVLFGLLPVVAMSQSLQDPVHEDHESGEDHDSHDDHMVHAGRSSHAAHLHGTAQILFALDGRLLQLEFQVPAYDLLGFEQAPRTDAEAARLLSVTSDLGSSMQLLHLLDAAGQPACVQQTVELAPGLLGAGEHADIVARYELDCRSVPVSVQLLLFGHFPALEQVQVQWLLPGGQGAVRLSPAQPSHRF